MLNRIYYESRITGRFGPLALLALQKRCVRRNLEANITSFMFFDKTRIFQVLEGDSGAIDATMKRIVDNKMHSDVKIRAIMRCPERQFAHWPFGATTVHDADFKRVMNASQQSDFFALDVLQAERFLGIIASRKRRAVRMGEFAAKSRSFCASKKSSKFFSTPDKGNKLNKGLVHIPGMLRTQAADV